jgi:DNA-binding MarR family transcriptional regulator
MSRKHLSEVFELLVRVLPVMHKKMHRDIFKTAIEQAGEDIAPHHLMILKMLRENGPLSMNEIGEDIAISQPQMSHSTDKLIKLGMIERQGDTQDRRKINIRLTNKGKNYLIKIGPVMRNRMESKISMLTDRDMERLAKSLREISDIFTKLQWDQ